MTLHTALVLSSYFASIPSHGGKGSIRCNMASEPTACDFAIRSLCIELGYRFLDAKCRGTYWM